MSTEFYYVKESKKEMFHLGSCRSNADMFQELLYKIKSFQKQNLTAESVKEKCRKFLEKHIDEELNEDNEFDNYLINRFIPALMNWVDDSTLFLDEYTFEKRFTDEYGANVCESYYDKHQTSYIDKVYKLVGTIYEDYQKPNSIINFETTFERALTEMKAGKIAYRKTKPDVHYQIENGHLFVGNHGMILVKLEDILATDWVIL